MGMFDYITYGGKEYQTKDTPAQMLEYYEIRGNELWYKDTQYEWTEEEDSLFGGYLKEVSHEWKFMSDFDGVVKFYKYERDSEGKYYCESEYKAVFADGKMVKLAEVKNEHSA